MEKYLDDLGFMLKVEFFGFLQHFCKVGLRGHERITTSQ